MRTLKSLPIGISDYVRAQSEYYYVDKTMLIKEFLDKKPLVSLFTRPRRFGKTLNMDMLRVFFEKKAEDTSKFFTDKDIWKCGEEYRSYQGQYPVSLSSPISMPTSCSSKPGIKEPEPIPRGYFSAFPPSNATPSLKPS